MLAKQIQFAKLANLILTSDEGGKPAFMGTRQQWKEYGDLEARDDRGEFYERYPWQSISY